MSRYDQMLEEALDFHARHPNVWLLFVRFTRDRMAAGFTHYSVNAVFERIRWECESATEPERFKLNNNYRAFYARWFEERYPQHAGFFRKRHQRSHSGEAVAFPPLTPAYFPYLREELPF